MRTRWRVASLLACGAFAFGCADASGEAIAGESGDASANADPPDAAIPCESGSADFSTPEAALAAYSCLREASKLDVQVNRRGKPLTIEIPIQ